MDKLEKSLRDNQELKNSKDLEISQLYSELLKEQKVKITIKRSYIWEQNKTQGSGWNNLSSWERKWICKTEVNRSYRWTVCKIRENWKSRERKWEYFFD